MAGTTLHLPEDDARRVLLLQAHETAAGAQAEAGSQAAKTTSWTADDAEWASRVARASLGEAAAPAAYLAERARHAMQRLAPREAAVRRLLTQRFPAGAWTLAALLAGAAAGVLVDQIGGSQRINLLAPPIWLLVLWNLLVYVAIVLQPLLPSARSASDGRLRRWLQRLWSPAAGKGPALQRFGVLWAEATAALNGARAAWLLHLAAAALAAGVVAGLYLRGLVLDYRAGWQSTFLEAPAVHAVLSTLLAPAAAVTGIAVPDAAALALQRVQPGVPASTPAGPWLHLYAATLGLFVIAPRLLLAALAGLRLQRLGRRVALPADEPYFRRLLRGARTQRAEVWLLPHAAAPSAQAVLGLQALLAPLYRDGLHLHAADAVPYGKEDGQEGGHPLAPPAGTTLVAVLFDLGSTPEAEVQGQLLTRVAAAAAGLPLLVLVDEAGFVRRFGADAGRRAERRAAWAAFVQPLGLPLLAADLSAPDEAAHAAARQALGD